MMKTAIALGVLVALAGCGKRATTTYYAKEFPSDKPLIANAVWEDTGEPIKAKPRDTYIIKDGKPVLSGTATCTGIGGKQPCDINIKPKP